MLYVYVYIYINDLNDFKTDKYTYEILVNNI